MDELTTLISNVGFPIAAFCAMFYMCNTTIKENTKALLEIEKAVNKINTLGKELKEDAVRTS